jgi:hypothetical protein
MTTNVDRIIATELATSQAYELLAYLSDDIGPRPSGSSNAALAVQWTTERFRAWGIDVRNEPVIVPHWVRGAESARLVSHRDQKIVLTALGGSDATLPEGITADIVEVRSYDELQALGASVEGKIVFYNSAMDMDLVRAGRSLDAYRKAVVFRSNGASRAAERGAAGAIIRSVGSASLRTPHTGSMCYDPKWPRIPAAAVTAEDAMLMDRLLARGDRVRMHLTLTPETLPDVESANVVAQIQGCELPDEIVLIGAHLDTWDLGTGAIDDGSGVAMVMETMRLLHEMELRPKRTIRCVLFMNEENGLAGGRAYFAAHQNEAHAAALEADLGAGAPTGFVTTLKNEALQVIQCRALSLESVGASRFETSDDTGVDISPLTRAGVPGFGYVTDPVHYFDYHHTAADTLDKVDPRELTRGAAAISALTWILANAPQPNRATHDEAIAQVRSRDMA